MAEAQITRGMKRNASARIAEENVHNDGCKKPRLEGKPKMKSPSLVLPLSLTVNLAIWKEKGHVRLQIDDGEKKINIPPDVWKLLHLSSEAITLLLSFIEGNGGISEYYDNYYKNALSTPSGNETVNIGQGQGG